MRSVRSPTRTPCPCRKPSSCHRSQAPARGERCRPLRTWRPCRRSAGRPPERSRRDPTRGGGHAPSW
ncbi:hypothetical protein EBU02_12910 [bacterium]|nr:hypothetical protein [bacterium]